jgi:hypothetical protein
MFMLSIVFFRVVALCDLVGGYQRFGGSYRVYLNPEDGHSRHHQDHDNLKTQVLYIH